MQMHGLPVPFPVNPVFHAYGILLNKLHYLALFPCIGSLAEDPDRIADAHWSRCGEGEPLLPGAWHLEAYHLSCWHAHSPLDPLLEICD